MSTETLTSYDEPQASASDVRDELDVEPSAYPSIEDDGTDDRQQLDRWIARAHRLVEKRLWNRGERDAALLEDLEILVAAHFAFPRISGQTDGTTVSSVSQGSASVSYDRTFSIAQDDLDTPGGYSSPYFMQAAELDERIGTDPFESYTL